MAKMSAMDPAILSALGPQMTNAIAQGQPKVVKASAKQPHAMSIQARPQRPPHPTIPGRDAFGRMMPGQLMQNAVAPFQAAKAAAVAVVKPIKTAPLPKPPMMIKPPPPARSGMAY